MHRLTLVCKLPAESKPAAHRTTASCKLQASDPAALRHSYPLRHQTGRRAKKPPSPLKYAKFIINI